ncbi:MAG: hypothetical protein ACLFQW_10935 [Spirochaetaceae bacterium]
MNILDEDILQQTAKRWPGVDPSISSKTGKSLFPLHLYYVETIAYEMGCIGKEGDEIVLTVDENNILGQVDSILPAYP